MVYVENPENSTVNFNIFDIRRYIYRKFRQMSKFLIISVVSERISRKSKAKQRRLSFGRFLTVETIRLSTFNFREIANFFGKRMALVETQRALMCFLLWECSTYLSKKIGFIQRKFYPLLASFIYCRHKILQHIVS